jgi:hypothetical protein
MGSDGDAHAKRNLLSAICYLLLRSVIAARPQRRKGGERAEWGAVEELRAPLIILIVWSLLSIIKIGEAG